MPILAARLLLNRRPQTFQQVKPVRNLPRLRSTTAGTLGVETATVPAHHVDLGMDDG